MTGLPCVYWRSLSGTQKSADKACHYLLDEGESRRGTMKECGKRTEGPAPGKFINNERWPLWPAAVGSGNELIQKKFLRKRR